MNRRIENDGKSLDTQRSRGLIIAHEWAEFELFSVSQFRPFRQFR